MANVAASLQDATETKMFGVNVQLCSEFNGQLDGGQKCSSKMASKTVSYKVEVNFRVMDKEVLRCAAYMALVASVLLFYRFIIACIRVNMCVRFVSQCVEKID